MIKNKILLISALTCSILFSADLNYETMKQEGNLKQAFISSIDFETGKYTSSAFKKDETLKGCSK